MRNVGVEIVVVKDFGWQGMYLNGVLYTEGIYISHKDWSTVINGLQIISKTSEKILNDKGSQKIKVLNGMPKYLSEFDEGDFRNE